MDTFKPTLYVSDKDLPQIKDWEVGEEYELIIKVKQRSFNEMQNRDGTKTISSELEVTDFVVPEMEDQDISMMDNEEFSDYSTKMRKKMSDMQ